MTANTATAPESIPATFDDLGLLPELLRAVAEQGYTEPTPIQRQAIPAVLARRDIMGSAQTGTGKTAAFGLPLVDSIVKAKPSAAKGKYLKSVTLSSTMGPGIRIDTTHIDMVVKH